MEKKILVVEDEKNISQLLSYNLKKAGYAVETAFDGLSGLNMAKEGGYDLILLDIMLPVMDGFEVCARIRQTSQVPIIFVTAREDEKDKILGLDTGADDYVTKPFSINELLSRVKANIRRASSEAVAAPPTEATETIVIGELEIDPAHYAVRKNGETLELSKKDYDVLLFLASHIGKVYSREELLTGVWGYDGYLGDVRVVDVTIHRLRSKFEDDPANPRYLRTMRGVGYYLDTK